MSREPGSMSRLFGAILITAGVLIAALSGLCTLRFVLVGLIGMLPGSGGYLDAPMILVAAVVTGIVPFLVGIGLVHLGRRLKR